MIPYKAQVSNASRLGATKIAVLFERNRRVYDVLESLGLKSQPFMSYRNCCPGRIGIPCTLKQDVLI